MSISYPGYEYKILIRLVRRVSDQRMTLEKRMSIFNNQVSITCNCCALRFNVIKLFSIIYFFLNKLFLQCLISIHLDLTAKVAERHECKVKLSNVNLVIRNFAYSIEIEKILLHTIFEVVSAMC